VDEEPLKPKKKRTYRDEIAGERIFKVAQSIRQTKSGMRCENNLVI